MIYLKRIVFVCMIQPKVMSKFMCHVKRKRIKMLAFILMYRYNRRVVAIISRGMTREVCS